MILVITDVARELVFMDRKGDDLQREYPSPPKSPRHAHTHARAKFSI